MTTREWARFSGVCKSTWRLPLLEVKATREGKWEYPAAALFWAAQRSSQIKVLMYDAYYTSGERAQFVATVESATHALSQICKQATFVQEVLLHANCSFEDELKAMEEMATVVTSQLAASALQLRTLKCHFGKLCDFPCMPTLKHLIIEVRYDTFQDGIGALNALQKLETLQITAEPFATWETSLSDHFECPVLDLTNLRCLRSFSLGFTPKGILVCSGCYVHVTLCCPADHQLDAANCPKDRSTMPRLDYKHLPMDIWQKVSSFMSVREWAQASGTCKDVCRAPLLVVKLVRDPVRKARKYSVAGLQWAAKRSGEAHVLILAEVALSASPVEATDALVQLATNARSLQEALIDPTERHTATFTIEQREEMAQKVAAQLAASAPQLRVLRCRARDLQSFPVFPSLKHLMLDLRNSSLREGAGTLTALVNLETLHLRTPGESHAHLYEPGDEGPGDEEGLGGLGFEAFRAQPFDCPNLDLSSLGRLHSLFLENITPAGIMVCTGCGVHVALIGGHCRTHPVWGVLGQVGDSLRSLTGLEFSESEEGGDRQPLPRVLTEAPRLERVEIQVAQWDLERLPAALARVRYLDVSGDDISFHVPAEVSWESLCVSADGDLDVVFDNVDAFARREMNFRFSFDHEESALGGEWLALEAAMARSKPNWYSLRDALQSSSREEQISDFITKEI
ncbi:hypothetical protein COCOBI_18-0540 [Coccomyxa sp. Obi]|nr:hypothetical protein COCOBI_18-0540 [Coccomyxa sp. Obi]